MTGRTLAIGDIHGCDTALETLLDNVRPSAEDTVVVLGDVVDRGPDSRRCIDLLLDLRERCELVFILGNHEEMMFDALEMGPWANSWMLYGGRETVESYGDSLKNVSDRHIEFLRSGVDYYQTDRAIFVHANLQPDIPLDRQNGEWLRWVHLTGRELPHPSGKVVICGHTRLPDGVPAILNGWICIDTAACAGGKLTCLNVDGMTVHQSTQDGEFHGDIPLNDIAEFFRRS